MWRSLPLNVPSREITTNDGKKNLSFDEPVDSSLIDHSPARSSFPFKLATIRRVVTWPICLAPV
jgi:hypothetical protein